MSSGFKAGLICSNSSGTNSVFTIPGLRLWNKGSFEINISFHKSNHFQQQKALILTVTRTLDFRWTSSWRSPSVRAVTAYFVALYMQRKCIAGTWPARLEARNVNVHVVASTDLHNNKTLLIVPRLRNVSYSYGTNTKRWLQIPLLCYLKLRVSAPLGSSLSGTHLCKTTAGYWLHELRDAFF